LQVCLDEAGLPLGQTAHDACAKLGQSGFDCGKPRMGTARLHSSSDADNVEMGLASLRRLASARWTYAG
jgi:hypothetical protein